MKNTILVAMMLFSGLAFADVKLDLANIDADYNECLRSPEGQSNSGMKMCTAVACDDADKVLNKVYQSIVGELKKRTGEKYSDQSNAETFNRLVSAQRAWITFRNTNSDLYGTTMLGGTGESLEIASQAYHMTRKRAQELADLLGSY